MLQIARIPVARQRSVGQQLRELLDAHTTLDKSVLADVRALIAATDALDRAPDVPKLAVDTTTDSVVYALVANVDSVIDGLPDKLVALDKEQAAHRDAATLVKTRAFGHGLNFLRLDMALEYTALRALADALATPEVAHAIKTLGLGYMVRHLESHLGPYGRAVKAPDGSSIEAASDAWHAAFEQLAIGVRAHYRDDPAMQDKLLGFYQRELDAHTAERRAARRQRHAATGTTGAATAGHGGT